MTVPIKRTDSAVSTCGGMSPCCLARVTASVNARTSTTLDVCGNALLLVVGEGFKVERPLVAEAVVHALAPDLHRLDQVAGRGGGKALRPEDRHGPFQYFVAIECSGPRHEADL